MKPTFTKYLLLNCLIFLLTIALSSEVNAFGISPSTQRFELSPGDVVDYQLNMRPTSEGEFGVLLQYSIEPIGVDFDENGNRIFIEDTKEATLPYSASHWLKFDTKKETSSDSDGVSFAGKLNVPPDTPPGTYYAALSATATEATADEPETAMGAIIATRAIANIIITIPGDIEEEAKLAEFKLDEEKMEQNDFVFITNVASESALAIQPVGEITIYDKNNEQVKGVIVNIKVMADGREVFESQEDVITFNPRRLSIPPQSTRIIETPWENKNIAPGEYTARLHAFYGREGVLEGEVDFEIREDVIISLQPESSLNSSLPVKFSGQVENKGSVGIQPNVKFEIKNIFGNTVFSENYSDLTISPGETVDIENLEWNEGFALGNYTAVLTVTYGFTGNVLKANATFMVINWWQSILMLGVILAIVLLVVAGTRKYLKLKKQLSATQESK